MFAILKIAFESTTAFGSRHFRKEQQIRDLFLFHWIGEIKSSFFQVIFVSKLNHDSYQVLWDSVPTTKRVWDIEGRRDDGRKKLGQKGMREVERVLEERRELERKN